MSDLFWVDMDDVIRARRKLAQARDDEAAWTQAMAQLALLGRIDTLSTIFNAQRGWIGACFSIMDVLAVMYYGGYVETGSSRGAENMDYVLLSKGHAAVAQYAILAGMGVLDRQALLRHNRPDGPQAHSDLSTPGIGANSGSLGQALSKGIGLALGGARRVFVILGDGELQEGQNFEALMSLRQFGLQQVIPVIDLNGIQSDSNVDDIKELACLPELLRGLGLNSHGFDGNEPLTVRKALDQACDATTPVVLLAQTRKAAGISFMEASRTGRRQFAWHGQVPGPETYRAALCELARSAEGPVAQRLAAFLGQQPDRQQKAERQNERKNEATGAGFGRYLVELADAYPNMRVLDADLEKSCHLTAFACSYPDRFIEMGIAEQDMVSCAGGLALRGLLPVVNTYAAFLRRGYEQIYANASEHTRVIYAGHYAGLCYGTDGKSHQCTGDIAMMRAIPGMHVLYPAWIEDIPEMLAWYLREDVAGPLYIRLHRLPPAFVHRARGDHAFRHGEVVYPRRSETSKLCVVTCGPHLLQYACAAVEALAGKGAAVDVCYTTTLRGLNPSVGIAWSACYDRLFVIEETADAGGLLDEVASCLAHSAPGKTPRLIHRAMTDFTFSTLEPYGLYHHFDFDQASLVREIERLL